MYDYWYCGKCLFVKICANMCGASNNILRNSLNWNCSISPDANTDTYMNTGAVIVNATEVCRMLYLTNGISFTVSSGVNFTVKK